MIRTPGVASLVPNSRLESARRNEIQAEPPFPTLSDHKLHTFRLDGVNKNLELNFIIRPSWFYSHLHCADIIEHSDVSGSILDAGEVVENKTEKLCSSQDNQFLTAMSNSVSLLGSRVLITHYCLPHKWPRNAIIPPGKTLPALNFLMPSAYFNYKLLCGLVWDSFM